MTCTGAEVAEFGSQTGAVPIVSSFVTVTINLLPSQAIQPAVRGSAGSGLKAAFF